MYRILIADDERMVLLSTEKTFPFAKYNMEIISRTTDSYEALALLEEYYFDAALIDIRMPGLSGIDIIQACREKNILTEFIVISGYTDFAYMKQAIQLGAFDYCQKPVQRKEADILSARLHNVLLQNRLKHDMDRLKKILLQKDLRSSLHQLGLPDESYNITVFYLTVPFVQNIYPLLIYPERQHAFLLSDSSALLLFQLSAAEAEAVQQACLRIPGCRFSTGTTDISTGHFTRLWTQLQTDLLLTTNEQPVVHTVVQDSNDTFQQLLDEVRSNYAEELSLQKLAQKYNFSYSYCSELFKSMTGYNFSKYITNLRMNAAARLLLQTDKSTVDISYYVGYKNYHHFIKMFKTYFDTTPTEYRQMRGGTDASS